MMKLLLAIATSAILSAHAGEPTARYFVYQYTDTTEIVLTATECANFDLKHPAWAAYAEDGDKRADGCWTHGLVIPNMPQTVEIHLQDGVTFYEFTFYKDKFEPRY